MLHQCYSCIYTQSPKCPNCTMLKHKGEVHVFHNFQCMALYLRLRVASESAPASFSNGLLCETEQLSCWSSLFMGSVCSVCLGFSRWLVYSTLCSEFCPAVILLPDMSSLVCAVGCCLGPIQVFLNNLHLGFHLHIQQALLTCNAGVPLILALKCISTM